MVSVFLVYAAGYPRDVEIVSRSEVTYFGFGSAGKMVMGQVYSSL